MRTNPRNYRCDVRQIRLVRRDSSPHRWETACPRGCAVRAGSPLAGSPPTPVEQKCVSSLDSLNRRQGHADTQEMSATIDDRLLERWTMSRRHQDEARRFLARQRFSDPRGERRALDEIVGTIADLEQTLRDRAARRLPPPSSPGPLSA